MIIIDTSVWILILNGTDHPKAIRGKEQLLSSEDIGIPGIILDEILRGVRNDKRFSQIKKYLLEDFEYLEMTRETFVRSAEIYRQLRRNGITLKNPVDCLIAAVTMENNALLLANDSDFEQIAEVFLLTLI